jgi:hypothetical protein
MIPCRTHPRIPLILIPLIILIPLSALGAEPVVTIESPILKSGMTSIQVMMEQSIAEFSGQINKLVDDSIDKPELLAGSSLAAAQAALVPSMAHGTARLYIGLGSVASYYSPGFSTTAVSDLNDLDATEDIDAGACVEPLVVRAGIPLNGLVRGLSLAASAGYMNAETGSFGIRSITAGLAANYELIPARRGAVAWDGVSVTGGGDFARQRLSVTVKANTVTEVIPIDPDGSGPLSSFDATVSVDPVIKAGIETTLISGHLGASTGITFFRALSLFAGAGATVGWSKSAITLDSKDPLNVSGYLGDLIETPGTIGISGTAAEHSTAFISPYVSAGLALSVGAVDLSIPVSIKPFDSIGAGVFIGVRL